MPSNTTAHTLLNLFLAKPEVWQWPAWSELTRSTGLPWDGHDGDSTPNTAGDDPKWTAEQVANCQAFIEQLKTLPANDKGKFLSKRGADQYTAGRDLIVPFLRKKWQEWKITQTVEQVLALHERSVADILQSFETRSVSFIQPHMMPAGF